LIAAYNSRGLAYYDKGNHDHAIADFHAAIRLDPNIAAPCDNRGLVYNRKGSYDRAIADLDTAIRLDPKNASAYNNRGFVYASKRDYARAIADYDQALTFDPSLTVARQKREALCGRGIEAECQARLPGGVSAQARAGGSLAPLQMEGGIFSVPVTINNTIVLNFTLDSGAADVSIPSDVVSTLMRTGTLTGADFQGEETYRLADGSTARARTFGIKSLKVGDRVFENVTGSVASEKGGLLLGQSFLSRFKSWSIDNGRRVLVLE
jgi:clan AA aspartic protease (TIGR02281 family)